MIGVNIPRVKGRVSTNPRGDNGKIVRTKEKYKSKSNIGSRPPYTKLVNGPVNNEMPGKSHKG